MSTGTLGTDGPLRVPETPGEPAFDAHHPPSAELASDCVHCGFCLPTCPTYVLWGEEMDSPRGRIYLMQAGLDGEPMSDAMVQHFDACLGCMACVTACPSGVQYDKLIEATRAQVERRHRPAQRAQRDRRQQPLHRLKSFRQHFEQTAARHQRPQAASLVEPERYRQHPQTIRMRKQLKDQSPEEAVRQ